MLGEEGESVNRNRIMIGLLAALLVVAGGVYGVNRVIACGTCPAHAQAKADGEVQNADATMRKADVEALSGDACCAAGQKVQKAAVQTAGAACATQTDARLTGVGSACATKADAKLTGAGSACATKTDAKLTGAGGTCATGAHTASAKGECDRSGTMSAEATLTLLGRCGIDINAAETDVLAAKLAEKGCAGYSAEQWATMIESARALETGKAEAILAGARGASCTSEECPLTLVAKELGTRDGESTQN